MRRSVIYVGTDSFKEIGDAEEHLSLFELILRRLIIVYRGKDSSGIWNRKVYR
jgi:hypothetical protein